MTVHSHIPAEPDVHREAYASFAPVTLTRSASSSLAREARLVVVAGARTLASKTRAVRLSGDGGDVLELVHAFLLAGFADVDDAVIVLVGLEPLFTLDFRVVATSPTLSAR